MKRRTGLFALIVLFAGFFAVESAGGIEVYTFRKERVDQKIEGNRGYLMGKPKTETESVSGKRTLIGVDIELPPLGLLPEEEVPETIPTEEKDVTPSHSGPTTVVGTPKPETVIKETFREDEWIK
jgi:hypothetical protein